MDREIVLQTATKSLDSKTGEQVIDWDEVTEQTIWAQWLPAGTTEAWRAQQRLQAIVDGVFRIYDMDPRPTPDGSRILWDGKVFDIKPVVEIGRGEGLEVPVVAIA